MAVISLELLTTLATSDIPPVLIFSELFTSYLFYGFRTMSGRVASASSLLFVGVIRGILPPVLVVGTILDVAKFC